MSKSAIFYFIESIDNYTISQYNYLYTSGRDIYVCIPTNVEFNPEQFFNLSGVITYDINTGYYPKCETLNGCSLNKINVLKSFYELNNNIFDDYDYIYCIEPTFRYSKTLELLFNELDLDNSDLLTSYIRHVKNTSVSWTWYSIFKSIYNENDYKYILKSYDGGFIRISNSAVRFLVECNDKITDYFVDLALPTLLYNNEFIIKSLSSGSEDDDEFAKYNYCTINNYYFNTRHFDLSEINPSFNLIYNTYKHFDIVNEIITRKKINPLITVVLPVYNDEANIEHAIESVLSQENFDDFELWCLNDGSTDNTLEILKKYKDHPNVVIISREHKGLINTLNFALNNIKSKYIVRFDSDDICLPNRLRHQFDYMESHPNIDILSSSILLGYKNDKVWDIGEYTVTLEHLKDGNRLIHPAVIMRTESLYKLPFYYEYYYESAEDYKLWVTAVLHGLTVCTERTPVIRYSRPRSGGIEQDRIAARIKNLCCQCINGIKPSKQHEMTAIVTFRNEYEEIEKTIASIRATTKDMPIILLNDASDNDYDYKFVAEKYDCFYLEHSTPAGVAGGRIAAIKNVKTKYFIILDGHMRMYEDDWDLRAIDIIEKNGEDNVYFGRTAVISKTDRNNLINENGQKVINTYGACLAGETYPLVPKWITTPSTVNFDNNENIIPVPLLLGADYMMSVNFWNKIQGLNGLLCWGQDETLLSLKTWLAGSKVLLIKDMIFGHVYRKKRPYTTAPVEMNSNYIYCNYLFSRNEQEFNELNYLLEETLGKIYYTKTYKYFMKRFEEAKAFKEYFYNNIAERDMDWFWEFNYNADPKQVQTYYDKRDKILSKMIK